MHCAPFQELIEIIFKFSADLGVRMFALYVSDVLQTWTENFEQPKNDSIASESPEWMNI